MSEELIREGIQVLAAKGATRSVPGVVKAVDQEKCLCEVALASEEEIILYNVRLRATDDETDTGLVLFPKVGSDVLITQLAKGGGWFVSMFAEVDVFQLLIGKTKLIASKDGFAVERQNESLKKILTDLIIAIEKLTVTTGVGPSGTPINLPEFTAIKQRIPNLLINAPG